jgi:predicted ATP-grasp superfamily ATP-dependent carboligase
VSLHIGAVELMESVLVLDGAQRSALAATRSLGRKRVRVIVAEESDHSIAACSRFCAESFRYPSARREPDAFIDVLARQCRRRRVQVLYPMSDVTMYHVLKHRHALDGVTIPYGSFEAYESLTDKWKFFELTKSLGLSMPTTHFVAKASDLPGVARELRFPLVIKPYRSQVLSGGQWVHARVAYADSYDELQATVGGVTCFAEHPFLLQEYIRGENQGIFALCDRGVPQAFFANRRIRDVPPAGGMVVLAESIPMNVLTRAIAARLLGHVGWHGVAHVECMVRDGVPYVLETNARFWASTQLAVDCRVDYPWLLYQLATGRPIDAPGPYEERRRLRSLLGDFEHYYMTAARIDVNRYETDADRRRALSGFWRFWDKRTYYEINRWSDPGPFFYELAQSVRTVRPHRAVRRLRLRARMPKHVECTHA